jgi:hypothetical protein
MSYSFSIDEAVPSTSNNANLLGQYITDLKKAIHERMNTLVVDWTADPIALKSDLSGAQTGRKVFINYGDVNPASDSDNCEYHPDGWFKMITPNSSSQCPIRLPVGATITKFRVLHQNISGGAYMVFRLKKKTFALPTITTEIKVITMTSSTADAIGDSGTMSHTVDESVYYIVNEPVSGAYKIFGYEFTIDIPGIGSMV